MWSKYSELLQRRHKELFATPECDNGWFEIIDRLMCDIEASLTDIGLKKEQWPKTVQIKEKFGTLRYYIDSVRSDKSIAYEGSGGMISFRPISDLHGVRELISNAETKSAHVCERCGGEGVLVKFGWSHTYCADCESWYNSRTDYDKYDGVSIAYAESLMDKTVSEE